MNNTTKEQLIKQLRFGTHLDRDLYLENIDAIPETTLTFSDLLKHITGIQPLTAKQLEEAKRLSRFV